jgi:uncharacterized membrane-anchored protein
MKTAEDALSKIPAVTLSFWVIKVAATTLGETGGDAVTMTLGLGYLIGTGIFGALLIAAVSAQVGAKRFYPFLYWAVIIATTTVGTTLADLVDRSLPGRLNDSARARARHAGAVVPRLRLGLRRKRRFAESGAVLLGHDPVLPNLGHGAG